MRAFQQVKQEFHAIREDIDKLNNRLQAAHAAPHSVSASNGYSSASEDLKNLQTQLERLNAAEEELSFDEWDKQMKARLKKNPIKEVDEFISDTDTEELAEDYY